MKVILKKDIRKIGRKHDIKRVADGFARNYLIPRKLAVLATNQSENQLATVRTLQQKRAEKISERFSDLIQQIAELEIVIQQEATDKGTLYQAISRDMVTDALHEALPDADIDADMVHLDEPIKALGEHTVILRHNDMEATATILVEALPEEAEA